MGKAGKSGKRGIVCGLCGRHLQESSKIHPVQMQNSSANSMITCEPVIRFKRFLGNRFETPALIGLPTPKKVPSNCFFEDATRFCIAMQSNFRCGVIQSSREDCTAKRASLPPPAHTAYFLRKRKMLTSLLGPSGSDRRMFTIVLLTLVLMPAGSLAAKIAFNDLPLRDVLAIGSMGTAIVISLFVIIFGCISMIIEGMREPNTSHVQTQSWNNDTDHTMHV